MEATLSATVSWTWKSARRGGGAEATCDRAASAATSASDARRGRTTIPLGMLRVSGGGGGVVEALRAGRSGTRRRRAASGFSNRRHARAVRRTNTAQARAPFRRLEPREGAFEWSDESRRNENARVSLVESRASPRTDRGRPHGGVVDDDAFHMKSHTSIVPDCSGRPQGGGQGVRALHRNLRAPVRRDRGGARRPAGDGPPRGAGARGGDAGADVSVPRVRPLPRGRCGDLVRLPPATPSRRPSVFGPTRVWNALGDRPREHRRA